jgi:hypothetical protein
MKSVPILILGYYFRPDIVSHNDAMQLASVFGNSTIDIALDNGGNVNRYAANTGQ